MQYPPFLFLKQFIKHFLKGNFLIFKQGAYYKRWKLSLSTGRSPIVDQTPWLTFPAIDFLNKHVKEGARIFEYGGGGSTLFFLKKAKELITIVHDSEWFDLLKKNIPSTYSDRWQGYLIVPEQPVDTAGLDKSRPGDYFSGVAAFRSATFKAYSTFINSFPDAYFDVVLVDGRSRTSCLHHAVTKVKPGGYLILDNSERSHYLKNNTALLKNNYRLLLHEMAAVPYDPCFSRTSIWQRMF